MAKVTYNERSWAIDVISSIEVFLAKKSWHFKGAGRAITKTSINGWKYWRILDNGVYNDLSYYKEKYKQMESQR